MRFPCVAVMFAVSVAAAAPLQYQITFTLDSISAAPNFDILPSAGGFLYDSANPVSPFSNFTVVWRGAVFDLTASANASSASGFGCDPQTAAPSHGTNVLFQTFAPPCAGVEYLWVGNYSPSLGVQLFAFRAANPACCQTQVDAVLGINDPDGVFQAGEGSWTVEGIPEPGAFLQTAIGLGCLGAALLSRRSARGPLRRHRQGFADPEETQPSRPATGPETRAT